MYFYPSNLANREEKCFRICSNVFYICLRGNKLIERYTSQWSILRVFGTVKNIKDHEKHQDHSIGRRPSHDGSPAFSQQGQHRQRSQRNSDHRGSHSSRMGLFLKKEDLSLYPNLDQDLIKKAQNAQHNKIFCIFARYEQEGIHICPTLGGALEAIPSQLQLTISVCLAVRIPIDFPQRGQSA